jgi:hypothetical protein
MAEHRIMEQIELLMVSVDNWENIWGGDGFYVLVDYNNSNIIYAESQNGGLVKSTDGGFDWAYGTNGIDGTNQLTGQLL